MREHARGTGKTLCLALGLLTSALLQAESTIGDILASTVAEVEEKIDGPTVVGIGNFTYSDRSIGSSFSDYVAKELQIALGRSDSFEVFARDQLNEILEAAELSLSDLVDEDSAVEIGKLKGIRAIFSGSFIENGEMVDIFLNLVDIETGTYVCQTSFSASRRSIPSGVSILPDNYNDAMHVLDELYELREGTSGNFKIKAWTRKGDGGTFFRGETLVVNVYANRDCYVKIYHVGVDKNVTLMFPNPFHEDNFVKAHQLYKIPDSSYSFEIVLGEPFGTEFIKVAASLTQFDEIEESFVPLGTFTREITSRGFSVRPREELTTETVFSYTILDR